MTAENEKKDLYREQIRKMRTEEKAGLLSGKDIWSTKPVERLGISEVYLSDGPHGVRKQVGAADHLGLNASLLATCFPTAVTIANSWDPELGELVGELLGEEAVSLNVNVLLGPGLNVKRSPLCGRNFEYFSEDPYLSGKMAAAYIRGIQKNGISACPKHFAVNNRESMRMVSDSIVDERTLREIYLTGFEIAVKEGQPKAIMTSYNRVNGIYANENPHLLQDILRREWGFEGAVITDWGGSNDHIAGVEAGSTLEMPGTAGDSDRQLVRALKEGRISEDAVDARVGELLKLADETKIRNRKSFSIGAHHEAAEKAAAASIVLLKNEGALLPLKENTRVAVIGEFADRPRYQGAGSSVVNPTKLESALDKIGEFPLQTEGYARGFRRNQAPDPELVKEAVELAGRAEAVLLYVGLDEAGESEGLDRTHLKMPENQLELLEALADVNENIIVILSAGSVIEMPWADQCRAILHGGLGGQAQAGAMLKVITGKINPEGKLAETYPVRYEDTPARNYWNEDVYECEYREGPYIGYRYYETAGIPVRFPFGFGLSYTRFAYSGLEVSEEGVRFRLTNTGARDGSETAQLYIGKPDSAVFRPRRELKGFAKVFLKAGETKTVQILFDERTFRYYDVGKESWQVEEGAYSVMIGASSADIRLQDAFSISGQEGKSRTEEEKADLKRNLPSYYSGKIDQVSDEEFERLLGRPIPRRPKKEVLDMNDAICRMCDAKSMLARFVYKIIKKYKERSERKEHPDLNILFIYNMPFRGIAKMMNGLVSMEMAEALLIMVNGHLWKGMGSLLRGYINNRKGRKEYIKGGNYEEERKTKV